MKKCELLSPAGDMETLVAAVNNGADAVYIGGKMFGARAFAKNFSREELIDALKYCHLYGVRLYVTANTIIFEDEIEDFLDYINFLYETGVDAVIMQDLGMISLVRKFFPDLEIHASTQVNCYNDESLSLLFNMGVKRAVLAREMSIDEILALKCPIEKEVFIHGALCACYSGQCLFSSLNGGRSGNRGKCTGSCRLNYEIFNNGKLEKGYFLSTKDLCTVNHIKDILKANVDSLKIEGRMKSPSYVGYVTRVYRRVIDDYYLGKEPVITKEEMVNLYKLFNREFTNGYLFNDDIYNIKSPNHLGYPLGQVIKVDKSKIYIKLTDDLHQEDGIRFCDSKKGMNVNRLYNSNGLLVNHLVKGEVAIINNKINLKSMDKVSKTLDYLLVNDKSPLKKIPISFKLDASANDYLKLSASDGVNEVFERSILLDKAKCKSTSKEEILSKLNKLGSTPFYLDKCEINIDNAFIPMKFLNDLRRKVCEELILRRYGVRKKTSFKYEKSFNDNFDLNFSVLVRNEKQLKAFLGMRIYTEDYDLYKKYRKYDVYYKLPRIMSYYPNFKGEKLLVSDLGSIYKYANDNYVITDYPLNVSNSESVKVLKNLNVKIVTISLEADFEEILKHVSDIERVVYGRADLMILKEFTSGEYLKKDDYYFPIIHGKYTTILHHENICLNKVGRIILYDDDISSLKKFYNI